MAKRGSKALSRANAAKANALWATRNTWNRHTTPALRWRIVTQAQSGVPVQRIATAASVDRKTVRKWVRIHQTTGTALFVHPS